MAPFLTKVTNTYSNAAFSDKVMNMYFNVALSDKVTNRYSNAALSDKGDESVFQCHLFRKAIPIPRFPHTNTKQYICLSNELRRTCQ